MKRILYLFFLLFTSHTLLAQIPEDALRLGYTNPSGTARNQAIGGAMASLGGEISSLFVNPAGLGLYKTGEIVLSPGFNFQKSKGSFRGTDSKSDAVNKFNLGTSGLVWGYSNRYSRWKSNAFSIGVNRVANFNSNIYYKGQNDYSSFSEEYALDFAASGLSLDNSDWRNSSLISLPTKMAVYEYLVDTLHLNGGGITLIGQGEKPGLVDQERLVKTKGGITEIAFGYAANMDDKLYFGLSVGLPIVNYTRTTYIKESDATGNTDNDFNYASYEETMTQKGFGLNARLGLIAKPAEFFRVGVAVQTPSVYGLNQKLVSAKMVTDLENYPTLYGLPAGADSVTDKAFAANNDFKFDFMSPWKFTVSASYVLHEVEDVKQQRGFITADIEYVTVRSGRFTSASDYESDDYYDAVNKATKAVYKNTFNFRVGGELKFNVIMARLGFAYFGNPYKDSELKGNRMNLSGGLGYRNKGIFIDLTYVHSMMKEVNFPYRLSDKANTFADIKNNTGNVLLTLGFKF